LRQRNAKTGPPPPFQIGKPFPDDRAILWAPMEGLARSMELSPPAILITQGALREVIRHLSSSPEQELLGFLIGEPCECPKTHRRFLTITGTLRTGHAIAEDEPVQIPDAEWLGQQLEVRRRRSTLIGWYHSTPYLPPTPSALDLESHRARFTESWQCGLVISTEGNEPSGGFFRAHPDPAEGGAYVPFYEQVDEDGILEGGRFRTLIDWKSYSTSELVEHDDDERSVHRWGMSGTLAPPRSAVSDAPANVLPLMIPEPAIDGVGALPSRSRWVGFAITVAVALAVGFVGFQIWMARLLPEPPVSATSRPREATAVAPSPNAAMAAAQERADSIAAASAIIAQSSGAPRETTSVASAAPSNTPPAAAPAATTVAPPPAPVAPPPAPSAPPSSTPIPSNAQTAALSRFDSLADSLEHGLHNYHDRRADFGQKRLSCKELSYGYRAADEALVGLAKVARDSRALDADRRARYTQLSASMDTVNDDFDASKCSRQ
jgi:proteasome lid subunit RPN8/RPN11